MVFIHWSIYFTHLFGRNQKGCIVVTPASLVIFRTVFWQCLYFKTRLTGPNKIIFKKSFWSSFLSLDTFRIYPIYPKCGWICFFSLQFLFKIGYVSTMKNHNINCIDNYLKFGTFSMDWFMTWPRVNWEEISPLPPKKIMEIHCSKIKKKTYKIV